MGEQTYRPYTTPPKEVRIKIDSERLTTINPHPLHGAWTWDPLSLPSTLLSDPEHLDHLIYKIRTDLKFCVFGGEHQRHKISGLRKHYFFSRLLRKDANKINTFNKLYLSSNLVCTLSCSNSKFISLHFSHLPFFIPLKYMLPFYMLPFGILATFWYTTIPCEYYLQ